MFRLQCPITCVVAPQIVGKVFAEESTLDCLHVHAELGSLRAIHQNFVLTLGVRAAVAAA